MCESWGETALVSMHEKYSWCWLFVYAALTLTQASSDQREESENVVQCWLRQTLYEFLEMFNICSTGLKHYKKKKAHTQPAVKNDSDPLLDSCNICSFYKMTISISHIFLRHLWLCQAKAHVVRENIYGPPHIRLLLWTVTFLTQTDHTQARGSVLW